jgi:hypothetical protein
MFFPSKRTSPSTRVPSMRSFIRLSSRSSVDLPHPDGPMRAVTRFFSKSMEMSVSARNFP